MKICICLMALALAARAETYTLTNGVPVSGSVVSSIVAQVVIRTPLGAERQIPVAAFSKADRSRLPQDAAGIYANYIKLHEIATGLSARVTHGTQAVERELKSEIEHQIVTGDLHDEMMGMFDERDRLRVEIKAWREANDMSESTALERMNYVASKINAYRTAKMK